MESFLESLEGISPDHTLALAQCGSFRISASKAEKEYLSVVLSQ